MMFKPFFLPLLCGLFVTSAGAQPPSPSDSPSDYAYTAPLTISGQQGVVALRLPTPVYLKSETAYLDDIRIFDAQGRIQPHTFYTPTQEIQRHQRQAALFPVYRPSENQTTNSDQQVDIQTQPDGTVISVRWRTVSPSASAKKGQLDSLILDFGAASPGQDPSPPRMEALRFTPPAGLANYNTHVRIETSQDLKTWSPLGDVSLNWLSNQQAQTLSNDRFEFSPRAFRYARLYWLTPETQPFSSVQASTLTSTDTVGAPETLWLSPSPGIVAGDWRYTASVALPVEQITLQLDEPNIVYPVAIGTYVERPATHPKKTSEWIFQSQVHATFYQITQNGAVRHPTPLTISPLHQQEWVLRSLKAENTAQPKLGLSWQPATLVWLAAGTPPYTLSVGRADAPRVVQTLERVAPGFNAHELHQLESAQLGSLMTQPQYRDDPAHPRTTAPSPVRSRAYILWGILIVGVLILAMLAVRLFQQVSSSPPPDAPPPN